MSKLFLVPTPVGNLGDMTFRGVEVLRSVNLVLAEDTRTSRVLLQHYGIDTPLQSYHIFNEHQTVAGLVERLKGGTTIAVVTDAGTPGISDPGFLLVREAVKEGIDVECLPGATAFVPALVDSGLPCDRFYFEGFLPQKKGRQTRLQQLAQQEHTMIIYESPFRLQKTLEQLAEYLRQDRHASVSREISKKFEDTQRGTIAELIAHYKEHPAKGEIVIIVDGKHE